MKLTLKEAIQSRKLKLIAAELESLARQDRNVKKIVDLLKAGKQPNPSDINKLKGDTQDDVVMAFASVIGPSKTSAFLGESKEDSDIGDREGSQPAKYHSGLAASTKEKRDAQFKKQAKMSDDDPAAYKPAPGDKEAKTKESEYTKKYKEMFGESTTKTALEKKSEDSGIAYGILKDVYDRGVAAWRTGHRPGTTPAQWGMARVNSFITGGKTRTTADADLWKKHKGKNEEVDMSDHDLTEAAIKASVVEKEIADMVGKQNVKMKLGHIEFKHKGKMHKIPVDRGYVKGTDYDDFLEMQESVELDEAVRVDDSRYRRSHKEAPKGKGLWGFTTKSMGRPKDSEMYMPALSMDYKQAVEMGKKWADRQGSSVVYVLESVSKNTAYGYANRGRSTFKSMHKLIKQIVRADDDMVTNYLDSTHGRHLADAERDMSAMKLRDYVKKDFEKFKKDYDPKLFEAKDKMKNFRKQDDVRKMNQAERIKQKKIMKGYKFANPKPVKEANEEDMEPASPDEKSMALKQAEFIQYVGREIGEHLVANKEFPEWMQNKLSALHQKAKDMHATLGAHGGDEMEESFELDESVTAKIYDAAMFLKRLLGFESKYEERLRLKRAGAKKLEKGDIEGFIKDAEPFLNFIKDGKARYYRGLLNKLKMKAQGFNKLEGEDKWFAAMDAVDQMIQIRNYISKNKPQVKESVELEEDQKLFMFDNKKDAQAKAKEIRGKMMELGPKNFAVITKDLTVVREEDELDEMKVRGQEVFDKTFANRTQAENFAEKNGGTVRQVGRVFYVFKEEVNMSNYNYRTEAHSPMHVSKAIRVAENMAGDMTGAVEKIEKMGKGLSDHPKVKAALRMANESFDLTESSATLDKIKQIVDNQQHMKVDGVMVDMFTASAIMKVYNAVNDTNKKRMESLKAPRLADMAMTIMSMRKIKEDVELNEKYSVYKPLSAEGRALVIVDVKTFNSSNEMDKFLSQGSNKKEWKETGVIGLKDSGKYRMSVTRKSNGEVERKFMKGGIADLREKAESEAQAVAARIALKHKREGTKPEAGTASAEMMKMSEKDLEDFTKVKKGAPEKVEEAKMSDAEVLSAAKKLAANGKDEKAKKFGQGLVDFHKENGSFTPDQVAGLQNIMKNASFQLAKEDIELDEDAKDYIHKKLAQMFSPWSRPNHWSLKGRAMARLAKFLRMMPDQKRKQALERGLDAEYLAHLDNLLGPNFWQTKQQDLFGNDQRHYEKYMRAHDRYMRIAKGKKPFAKEELDLMESHFKVGDKVTCIASGMKGEVIKLDEPQTGKYYTVRRDDGKVMKYAADELKKVMKEALDPVDKEALKKKFKARKDKDIDNDGDVDSSDEYLHKRRSAISKAIAKEESEIKLKKKDVDGDGDADDLDKSLKSRQQKALDTGE